MDYGISVQDNDCQDNMVDGTGAQASNVVSSKIVSNDMEIDGSLEHKTVAIEESLSSTSVQDNDYHDNSAA